MLRHHFNEGSKFSASSVNRSRLFVSQSSDLKLVNESIDYFIKEVEKNILMDNNLLARNETLLQLDRISRQHVYLILAWQQQQRTSIFTSTQKKNFTLALYSKLMRYDLPSPIASRKRLQTSANHTENFIRYLIHFNYPNNSRNLCVGREFTCMQGYITDEMLAEKPVLTQFYVDINKLGVNTNAITVDPGFAEPRWHYLLACMSATKMGNLMVPLFESQLNEITAIVALSSNLPPWYGFSYSGAAYSVVGDAEMLVSLQRNFTVQAERCFSDSWYQNWFNSTIGYLTETTYIDNTLTAVGIMAGVMFGLSMMAVFLYGLRKTCQHKHCFFRQHAEPVEPAPAVQPAQAFARPEAPLPVIKEEIELQQPGFNVDEETDQYGYSYY